MTHRTPVARWTLLHHLLLFVYDLGWLVFIVGWLLARAVLAPWWGKAGLRDRLGWLPTPTGRECIWIHAVSVGEWLSIRGMVRELKTRRPSAWVQVTVANLPTLMLAHSAPTGADAVSYLPWDARWCVRQALRRLRPQRLVIVECELWPNLLREANRSGAPVLMVNARIYERDFPRYLSARSFFRPLLQRAVVRAQSVADAERYRRLAGPDADIAVAGNTKFDLTAEPAWFEHADQLRKELGWQDGPVLVLASTHEGEEASLLPLVSTLRTRHPDLRLLLAPRHRERGERVRQLAITHGWDCCLRTEHRSSAAIVLNTMGQLRSALVLADVVFVGGSLVDRGGHNPIEPAVLGKATVMGPSVYNFADVVRVFDDALIIGADATAVATHIERFLADQSLRTRFGARLQSIASQQCGASRAFVDEILLPGAGVGRRAA